MASKKVNQNIAKFRKDILSGELAYGTLLPSEMQLAESLNVSRPTVAKIYDALKEEGLIQKKPGYGTSVIYQENINEKSFGLLFPGAGESEIFGEISDHFLEIERKNDVKFLWEGTIANNAEVRQETVLEICQAYIKSAVSGVFFAPLERVDNADYLNKKVCSLLESNNIPVILLDRDIEKFPERSNLPVVGLNNYEAGYKLTKHLIDNGCDNLYFLSRKDSANSVNERIAGFTCACFDAGINFSKQNMIVLNDSNLLELPEINIIPKKTGIICLNDSTAANLMAILFQEGYQVSKDVVIVGYDDMKYAKVLQVPLTSYRQPLQEIVSTSYKLMVDILDSDTYNFPLSVTISGQIIVRQSSVFA